MGGNEIPEKKNPRFFYCSVDTQAIGLIPTDMLQISYTTLSLART